MQLEISFGEKKMKTSVYIKMDAYDQLLLSEGVCRQIGIIVYHPDVHPFKQKQEKKTSSSGACRDITTEQKPKEGDNVNDNTCRDNFNDGNDVLVPMVCV